MWCPTATSKCVAKLWRRCAQKRVCKMPACATAFFSALQSLLIDVMPPPTTRCEGLLTGMKRGTPRNHPQRCPTPGIWSPGHAENFTPPHLRLPVLLPHRACSQHLLAAPLPGCAAASQPWSCRPLAWRATTTHGHRAYVLGQQVQAPSAACRYRTVLGPARPYRSAAPIAEQPPHLPSKPEGMRLGVRGRCTPSSHGRSMPNTSR